MSSSLKTRTISYRSAFAPVELTTESIQLPVKPHQLVVKTTYTTLNPIEVKARPLAVLPLRYRMGLEFSGVVEHVGSGLTSKFKPGDKVCGHSRAPGFVGSRSLIDTNSSTVMHVPQKLSMEEAAAFPVALGTAWTMIDRLKLKPEHPVLVLGGGTTVGAFTLQLLKKFHKVENVVSVNSAKSDEFAHGFGADVTIDYRTQNVPTALKAYVAEHGRFQAILDVVGGTEVLHIAPDILRPYSEDSAYLTCSGDADPKNDYTVIMWQMICSAPRILSRMAFSRQLGLRYALVTSTKKGWPEKTKELFDEFNFKAPVDTVFPVADFKSAIEKMEKIQAKGKILIKFDDEE